MKDLRQQFDSPEEELNYLRAKVAQRDRELESFLASAADAVGKFACDEHFTILSYTDGLLRLMGQSAEDMAKTDYDSAPFIHPEDREMLRQAVWAALPERKPITVKYRLRNSNGSDVWVKANALFLEELYQERYPVVYVLFSDITESVTAAEQVRQQYEKVLDLYNAQPCAFIWLSLEQEPTFRYLNIKALSLLGYDSMNTFIADRHFRLRDFLLPEEADEVIAAVSVPAESGAAARKTFRLRRRDGTVCWLALTGEVRQALSGNLLLHCVLADVTPQKAAENALRQRYQMELDFLAGAQSHDLLGKVWANLSQNRLLEYVASDDLLVEEHGNVYTTALENTADQCATQEMHDAFLLDLDPNTLTRDMAEGKTSSSREYLRRMKDGSFRWVKTNIRLYLHPESGDVMFFLYTYDVDMEHTSRALIDRMVDMDYEFLALLDTKEQRLTCYRAGRLEAFLSPSDMVDYYRGLELFIANNCPEEYRAEMRKIFSIQEILKALETQDSYSFSFTVKQDGEPRRKKWQMAYLDDSRTTVIFTRSDVHDLFQQQEQQRQLLQEALVQAEQASAAKSEFLSRMSHEIRTPMNAILGMTALAVQSSNDPRQVEECLSKVSISAQFLLSLINDILDMSRIESGRMTLHQAPIPFDAFIRGVNAICAEQAGEKGVHYESVLSGQLEPQYLGDPMKLQQVLINLIANAVKFTPAGGSVRFTVQQEHLRGNVAHLRFTVWDNGIGISREFQQRMFQPFEQEHTGATSSYGGTGLGLAICKNLVELMHGQISVSSTPGVGSTFTVRLPLELPAAGQSAKEPAPVSDADLPVYDFSGRRCLLVEDHPMNVEVARRLLQAKGMAVEAAANGLIGLQLFSGSPEGYFDVVIMDIRMPVMDGLAAASAIRQLSRNDAATVPILAMSANAFEEDVEKSLAAGMNVHLAKPIAPAQLYAALTQFLPRKQ